jgi:hypothetical protein
MRGRVGPGDELAPPEEEYPYLEWTSAPTLTDAGEGWITISGTESFTVRTADSIAFRASPMSSGVRGWIHFQMTRRRSRTIRLDLQRSMGRDRRGLHDPSPPRKLATAARSRWPFRPCYPASLSCGQTDAAPLSNRQQSESSDQSLGAILPIAGASELGVTGAQTEDMAFYLADISSSTVQLGAPIHVFVSA